MMPVIGSEVILEPSWSTAVGGTIGSSTESKYVTVVEAYVDTAAPGYPSFKSALLASNVPQASTYLKDPFTIANYNAVNMVSLAILKSHSTNRTVINNTIMSIVTPSPGAVTVTSFAAGKKALLAGKKIYYSGAAGPIKLNKYHNTAAGFRVVSDSLSPVTIGSISQSSVLNLTTKASKATKG
jgi:hypothetical protein